MSRKKTEINPKRAENLKTLITRVGLTQKQFGENVGYSQQNLSNIIKLKTPLTEEAARLIIEKYPDYRIEWLLGYDDCMTNADLFTKSISLAEKQHDNNISVITHLAGLRKIDFYLYSTGFLNTNGIPEDQFIVRKDGQERFMTYSQLSDMIDDLSALVESQLTRFLSR